MTGHKATLRLYKNSGPQDPSGLPWVIHISHLSLWLTAGKKSTTMQPPQGGTDCLEACA